MFLEIYIDWVNDVSLGGNQYLLSQVQHNHVLWIVSEEHMTFKGFKDIIYFVCLILPDSLIAYIYLNTP